MATARRESIHSQQLLIMWNHYCPQEKAWIGIERGQDCNWCQVGDDLDRERKPFLRLVEPVKPETTKEIEE